MAMPYLSLNELLLKISQYDRVMLQEIWKSNHPEFSLAYGSVANHQAWPGGYIDHITETMNLAHIFYKVLGRNLDFSLSSALKIMFLHDIEKPWRFKKDKRGRIVQHCLKTKKEKAEFRKGLMEEYGVTFSRTEDNAMRYVEGEHRRAKPHLQVLQPLQDIQLPVSGDILNALAYIEGSHGDYHGRKRIEGPLATFCHLWWLSTYVIRPKGTTFSLESLYREMYALRPLPFTLTEVEIVRQLYFTESGLNDFTRFEHVISEYLSTSISHAQWKSLKNIKRYPREQPLPQKMVALAGFCHMCDVTSARLWHQHPLKKNDPWKGASRSHS